MRIGGYGLLEQAVLTHSAVTPERRRWNTSLRDRRVDVMMADQIGDGGFCVGDGDAFLL
jgi:hypothetical protein